MYVRISLFPHNNISPFIMFCNITIIPPLPNVLINSILFQSYVSLSCLLLILKGLFSLFFIFMWSLFTSHPTSILFLFVPFYFAFFDVLFFIILSAFILSTISLYYYTFSIHWRIIIDQTVLSLHISSPYQCSLFPTIHILYISFFCVPNPCKIITFEFPHPN